MVGNLDCYMKKKTQHHGLQLYCLLSCLTYPTFLCRQLQGQTTPDPYMALLVFQEITQAIIFLKGKKEVPTGKKP
ncbi:hypothetical protein HanIR_Chr05g0229781 [Helianthus annuus]|nr:hypothetical protein HanIR_Chr05g0229781 [Helianthus annuus]